MSMIAIQIANALALASLLTMLASGLALIYGLRDVMNFGHGALYMIGAYIGYSVASATNFWVALVVAPIALAFIGIVFEYAVLRPLQHRSPIDLALVTFGLALIVGQGIVFVYGGAARDIAAPAVLSGSVPVFGALYPIYRIFLIIFGIGVCLLLAAWLRWTRSGMYVRAVSVRPEVARMMGVNTDRLSLLVVCLSAASAGVAGVLAGPYLSVDPGMGQSILISCLIIVVIGGVGSIGGAIAAAVLYGFIQVIGSVLAPSIAVLTPYLLLVGVLIWRPQGLGRGRI
jgi:branched-chain amino acid transport system permease protein